MGRGVGGILRLDGRIMFDLDGGCCWSDGVGLGVCSSYVDRCVEPRESYMYILVFLVMG
jgi:hypothetical protein